MLDGNSKMGPSRRRIDDRKRDAGYPRKVEDTTSGATPTEHLARRRHAPRMETAELVERSEDAYRPSASVLVRRDAQRLS